eukprot:TRINITY_DN1010_c0_g1_i4.p1 TRINITY_DN1010_c0_g1~~TRINITY_DN1010_c0_g1_i4.p1  ORF type:complete len:640 (+),score=102.35 TRINITY_DN1010_c0_g1_i4:34-1920(+)
MASQGGPDARAESMQCKLCCNPFEKPVLLDCGHSVCLRCAEMMLSYDVIRKDAGPSGPKPASPPNVGGNRDSQISCPTCSVPTSVPAGGDVSSLRLNRDLEEVVSQHRNGLGGKTQCANFDSCASAATVECAKCESSFCDDCFAAVHAFPAFKKHEFGPVGSVRKPSMCPVHPTKELELYCLDDKQPVCNLCERDRHKGHDTAVLSTHAEASRAAVLKIAAELQQRSGTMRSAAEAVNAMSAELTKTYGTVEQQINESFERVRAALAARQAALLNDANLIRGDKVAKLDAQRAALERVTTQLATLAATVSDTARSTDAVAVIDALAAAQAMLERSNPDGLQLKPVSNARLCVTLEVEDLIRTAAAIGSVSSKGIPGTPALPKLKEALSSSLKVEWAAPDDNGDAITSYTLQLAVGGGSFSTVYSGNSLTFSITGLTPFTAYQLHVCAHNSIGASPFSADLECQTTGPSSLWDPTNCNPEVAINGNVVVRHGDSARMWKAVLGVLTCPVATSFRIVASPDPSPYIMVGLASKRQFRRHQYNFRNGACWALYCRNGTVYSPMGYGTALTCSPILVGSSIVVSYDKAAGQVQIAVNGKDYGVVFKDVHGDDIFAYCEMYYPGDSVEITSQS